MRIAYILFDGITLLDFVGFYEPIKNIKMLDYIKELDWDLCAMESSIQDSYGLEMKVDKVMPDLSSYDMIVVPGGYGTRPLQFNEIFLKWIRTAVHVKYKVSICTGSLLLGAAGFLRDRKATTNFNEYDTLNNHCDDVVAYRIVDDRNVITAGAVATSLDAGLYICQKLVGPEKTEVIRKYMDYYPSEFEILKIES